ncbi:50S ribosome-binding GTPase [Candidatus Woesearchaeota archaeon]|nr:50S ribosome-binding GTPase [Candidatus Woesearchaeota archaeon]
MKRSFWDIAHEVIRRSDVVLEVLDARMPELTRVRKIEDYAARYGKKLIFVINKKDLISRASIEAVRKSFLGRDYIMISSKIPKQVNDLIRMIKSKARLNRIRVAFVGYPNTGKSSLLNTLSRKARARSSSESGFTKGMQLITGKAKLMLIDTPGVVPFEQDDEVRLGLVSGISPAKLKDPDLVAYKLIELFKEGNPSALKETYGVDAGLEPEELLASLAEKMSLFMKGGVADEKRAAIRILSDWHKGKIRL